MRWLHLMEDLPELSVKCLLELGGCWLPALIVLPRQILAPIVTPRLEGLRVTSYVSLWYIFHQNIFHTSCRNRDSIFRKIFKLRAWLVPQIWDTFSLLVSCKKNWVVFQTGVLLLLPGDQQASLLPLSGL